MPWFYFFNWWSNLKMSTFPMFNIWIKLKKRNKLHSNRCRMSSIYNFWQTLTNLTFIFHQKSTYTYTVLYTQSHLAVFPHWPALIMNPFKRSIDPPRADFFPLATSILVFLCFPIRTLILIQPSSFGPVLTFCLWAPRVAIVYYCPSCTFTVKARRERLHNQ